MPIPNVPIRTTINNADLFPFIDGTNGRGRDVAITGADLADAVAGVTGLTVSDIGTTVQAWDADLDALAALTAPATKLAGIETGATADQTAAEILAALLTVDGAGSGLDADLLDGISSAGFDAAGTATSAVSAHAGAADPHADRAYTDAQIASFLSTAFDFKASVRAATTANITLSGSQTIDGVSVVAGNRVLVKNQSTASQNGIYVAASGAWARATDADADAEVTAGLSVPVEEGTISGGRVYLLTTANPITVGATSLSFSLVDAGDLRASNNLSDLTSALSARSNLGLGTAALISATAGGDLSGTLPSPTVAKINGIAVTGTPSVGYVPTATSSIAATWQAPTGGSSSASPWSFATLGLVYT